MGGALGHAGEGARIHRVLGRPWSGSNPAVYGLIRRTSMGYTGRRAPRGCAAQRVGGCIVKGGQEFAGQAPDALFRLLVESVQDYAIFLLDPDGRVRTWNAGARRIKGYATGEIVGRHFAAFYTPEDVAAGKPERGLRAAMTTGHWEDEGWRVRRDGSRFWASVVLTALRDEEGQLVGFAKVTRDLTERHRAEEERARLLAEERAARAATVVAERAVRARDTFMSIAAHELRTPLTALKGTTQLLLRRAARDQLDPAYLRRALAMLDQTTDRLVALTDELLDVARLRTGQLPLAPHPTDLAALVAQATEQARARHDGGARLTLTAEPALPAVMADPGRIEQVLTNVLANALKYSPGGEAVTVDVRAAGAGVAVTVRDGGIGLPPGTAETIFEPFGRAANATASNLPGLGLGLFICRGIIAGHAGWIRAESPGVGLGTTVTFWLPAA